MVWYDDIKVNVEETRKLLLPEQYYFQNLTNERTLNRIVNNMIVEIDSFSKLIFVYKNFNQEK